MLSVLSPTGVPHTMLTGTANPDQPLKALAAVTAVQERLAPLADTSLVTFAEGRTTVVMHRLIQRVIRERATVDETLPAAVDYALDLLHGYNQQIPGGAHTWAARTTVEALLEQTDTLYTLTAPDLSSRLLTLRVWCGRYLTDLADFTRAIPLLKQTLADYERVLGVDHPDTLNSRNNLAGAYQSAGDLDRAIPLYGVPLMNVSPAPNEDHLSRSRPLTGRDSVASS
ncbi:hypothetical protein GCM10022248_89430 [Nonomuraea soli]